MIIFEVPENKPSDDATLAPAMPVLNLYIPANKEIIDSLQVDDTVDVIIKGKVKSTESRESSSDEGRYEFTIEPKIIKVDGENEFTKLAEDDD